ncbi:hypothetical protein M8C21_000436, partial [Ambrosia artemisiifolia]
MDSLGGVVIWFEETGSQFWIRRWIASLRFPRVFMVFQLRVNFEKDEKKDNNSSQAIWERQHDYAANKSRFKRPTETKGSKRDMFNNI